MSDTIPPAAIAADPLRKLLRAEGGAEFVILLILYQRAGGSWWLFAAAFLAPDLGLLGYLAGPRVGSACYNALHLFAVPALLGAASLLAGWPLGVSLALIWGAHIAFDRMLGYGLKYNSGFGDTHLGRIGRSS